MPLLLRHRLLLLLFVFVLLAATSHGDPPGDTYDASKCQVQNYTCGNVIIRYPFYYSDKIGVVNGNSGSYCGYPGLAIQCEDDEAPVVRLGEDKYSVTAINYSSLTISLADPDALKRESCPKVDHNVTLPAPPASWLHLPNGNIIDYLVLFLDCSAQQPPSTGRITCTGFGAPGSSSFVLPKGLVPQGDWTQLVCRKVIEVPMLKYGELNTKEPGWGSSGYARFLRQGFQLAWQETPAPCKRCEQSGSRGRCGYNETGGFIGCLCPNGRVNATPEAICSATSNAGSTKRKATIIGAGVASGFSALFVAGVIAILFVRKRKQRKVTSSSKLLKNSGSGGTPRSTLGDVESGSFQDPQTTHLFSYEELEEATDSFNDSRELGDGGFGTVYKGFLRDGRVVAVKRLYNNNYRRVEQFVNEAAILSLLRHPNLVMFYGCTSSQSRALLLVYEFVPNGTVADHLHGHRAPERALSWPLRLKIAIESAAALTYLHAVEPPIVHRDVKTTNILLDADFHVKVADFGLSRLFPLDVTHVSTAPQGTPGYVDPEYHQCYQLTDKSDVYSFGVVLVELISSKPAVDITRQRNEINLAGMAISKIQKCQLEQLVDLDLGYDADPATRKMMTMVAELAFRCLQQNGEMRPPIKEVLEVLRGIQDGCLLDKDGSDKHKDDLQVAPFSPDTVHAPWESRSTTPNTSQ